MNQQELFTLGIDIGSTTVRSPFWMIKMMCFSLIMKDILQISRKPFLTFWEGLSINSVLSGCLLL